MTVTHADNFVGIGTTTPGYTLDVASANFIAATFRSGLNGGTTLIADAGALTGNAWAIEGIAQNSGYAGYFMGNVFSTGLYQGSDEKLKENIQPMQNALDKIMMLDVKTYDFKTKEYAKMNLPSVKQNGFIAQNLETVFPELVKLNPAKGEAQPFEFKAVNYIGMIPVLTRAMQEQQQQFMEKDAKIDAQQKQIDELKAQMKDMTSVILQCCSDNTSSLKKQYGDRSTKAPHLDQNAPNPFVNETVIRWYLPLKSTGILQVTNSEGKQILSEAIQTSGNGEFVISPGTLLSELIPIL